MTFDQSFYNQSSLLSINVMVVDDDPVFLQVMSRMLVKSKYRDPSIIDLTVIAVKNSMEALSTLKIQKNNIDLIVTDYYMPGMNGIQLKAEITREYGNLPIIVISSDNNKEQESLTCGAKCFIPKPIKPIDLTKIYELALTSKRNCKSILQPEHNHKETNISAVPKQIQLLPEQTNVLTKTKTKKTKYLARSDSRSVNSANESCVSTNGLRKNHKRKSNGGSGGDVESSQPSKKKKITWTDFLHDRFLQAIRHIGLDKAVPKKILEFMNVENLTRENVASHLQKYRIFLRKVADEGLVHSSAWLGRDIESTLPYAHFRELYDNYFKHSNSWYDTSLNDRSFYSKARIGYGQSRLLSNPREPPMRSNQIPYNYMNRSSIYEPRHIGSNVTVPIRSNLNFSNQPSLNDERRSFLEPPMMTNKISQTSQVLGFGQQGMSTVHGTNFNNNMISNYGSTSLTQPRLSNCESFTPNQSRLNDYRTPTLYQPAGLNNYGSLTPNQLGMSSYVSSTSSQPVLRRYGNSITTQPGLKSYGNSTLNQPELSSYGHLTPNQLGPTTYGSSTPTQSGFKSNGNSTLNQPELSSYGSANPNQPWANIYGSISPNQLGPSSYESLALNQPRPNHFAYGMQSFSNNENAPYQPLPHANATTQPNVEIPQLENLNLYDDLNKTNELPCNISNYPFDQNKQQGEATSTENFEHPANFSTELDQIFSLQEDGDWNFVNRNEDHFIGETSNTFATPEMNATVFNMNPNHNQEQDFIDWSLLDTQDLVDDDFMNSVFNNDMN